MSAGETEPEDVSGSDKKRTGMIISTLSVLGGGVLGGAFVFRKGRLTGKSKPVRRLFLLRFNHMLNRKGLSGNDSPFCAETVFIWKQFFTEIDSCVETFLF